MKKLINKAVLLVITTSLLTSCGKSNIALTGTGTMGKNKAAITVPAVNQRNLWDYIFN
jgi:hypothetical protein